MTDIVDYMRAVDEERCNVEPWTVAKRCADAADEIERLRAALKTARPFIGWAEHYPTILAGIDAALKENGDE